MLPFIELYTKKVKSISVHVNEKKMKSWAKTPSGPDSLYAHSPAAQAGAVYYPLASKIGRGSASQDSHSGRVHQEMGSLDAE